MGDQGSKVNLTFGTFEPDDPLDDADVSHPVNVNVEALSADLEKMSMSEEELFADDTEDEDAPHTVSPVKLTELVNMATQMAKSDGKFTGQIEKGQEHLEEQLDKLMFNLGTLFSTTGATDPRHKALAMSKMLAGPAFTKIMKLSTTSKDGSPILPPFSVMVNTLKTMVKGQVPGDVSITIKLFKYCLLAAGVVSAKAHGMPNLQAELQQFQKEIDRRSVPLDPISLCALYVNAVRNIPELLEEVRYYQDKEGVKVEQEDPVLLLRAFQAHSDKFSAAVFASAKMTPNGPSGSCWQQQRQQQQQQKKRNFAQSQPVNANKKAKPTPIKMGNPFESMSHDKLFATVENPKQFST